MWKNIFWIVALLLVVILGNSLRSRNYDVVPHPGETTDEYGFAWAGLSLIENGVPTSWSGVESVTRAGGSAATPYDNKERVKINVDNIFDKDPSRPDFLVVTPWFDKPPAFALLIGGYSYLKGAREFFQTGVGIIRRPMLRIAILTTVLIFILGARLYNNWVGLLSALFYSVIPTSVISSRLAMAENGYIPLFLGALIFLDYYLKKKKDLYLVLAAGLAAVAILFKISGICVLLSLLLVLLLYHPKKGKKKALIKTFLIGISGLVVFFIYGFIINWKVFLNVFVAQSDLIYGAGADVFFSVLTRNSIAKFFTDGWILLAWISSFLIIFSEWKKERATTILGISLFSYLAIFLIFGSEGYGWYRFPFLPFIIMFLARLTERLFVKPNLILIFTLFLIPLGVSMHKILGLEGFQSFVFPFRVLVLLVLGVFALDFLISKKIIWPKRIVLAFFLLSSIFFAIKEILYYNIDNWFFVT